MSKKKLSTTHEQRLGALVESAWMAAIEDGLDLSMHYNSKPATLGELIEALVLANAGRMAIERANDDIARRMKDASFDPVWASLVKGDEGDGDAPAS